MRYSREISGISRMLIVVRDLRPCEIWRPSYGPLDFLCSIRKEKGNRKVSWSSRQLSSLFPLGSTFSAPDHPPSSFLFSHDEFQGRWSIDRFPRAIDPNVYARGELRQSSSTAYHNFRFVRSIPPKTISSSQITIFSRHFFFIFSFFFFFSLYFSFYCCCCCCCCVILL